MHWYFLTLHHINNLYFCTMIIKAKGLQILKLKQLNRKITHLTFFYFCIRVLDVLVCGIAGSGPLLWFIIWLAPRAGKMSQILLCDWLPVQARWSYLARSGLPVARPLGIESLIPGNNAIFSSIFSLFWEETLTKMFG